MTVRRIEVVNVITGLGIGGAEMMLYNVLSRIDRERFNVSVISLTHIGPVGQRIQGLGVPVRSLGMGAGNLDPIRFARLVRWLRESRADVVQTWMYHADLIGGFAAKLAGRARVIWCIQNSTLDSHHTKRSTLWAVRLCSRVSTLVPHKIVCCAEASRWVHVDQGYSADRMVVIPNAFDLGAFKPDPTARAAVRRELGLRPDAFLIGLVARYDPQKDHQNFIRAARILSTERPHVHFALVGTGNAPGNAELMALIIAAGIQDRTHLLGPRDDVARLNAAFDIGTLSSAYGEALPLALGEAMACEVPCVATDVGDAAALIGDTGIVVPVRDPRALAYGWRNLVDENASIRQARGTAARHRIRDCYSIEATVARYEAVYRDALPSSTRD
jgi:glycosyltransferase involved in cell wall biosynthesis